MIRIAISPAAFDAICATLPLDSVAVEPCYNERGERLIWIEDAMADRLGAMRGPGRATAKPSCGWRRPKAAKNEGHKMETASHPSKIMLTDVADVIEAARDVLRPFDNDTVWWRGHAKADWRLQAQVHRRDPKRQYGEDGCI